MERKTPEQIAQLATTLGVNNRDEIMAWLQGASSKEIQAFASYIGYLSNWFQLSIVMLHGRHAESAAKSAEILIHHTEQLTKQTDTHIQHTEKLTRQTDKLVWLTISLGVFAVVQIFIMVFDYLKHK